MYVCGGMSNPVAPTQRNTRSITHIRTRDSEAGSGAHGQRTQHLGALGLLQHFAVVLLFVCLYVVLVVVLEQMGVLATNERTKKQWCFDDGSRHAVCAYLIASEAGIFGMESCVAPVCVCLLYVDRRV